MDLFLAKQCDERHSESEKKIKERRDKRRMERKKETRKERGGTGGKKKGRKVCNIYSTIMGNYFLQDTSPINT